MSELLKLPDHESDPKPAHGSVMKRLLVGGILLLLAVIVLAELGVVSAESTQQKWSTKSEYTTNWSGRRGLLRVFTFAPTVQVTASGSGAAVARAAEKAIRDGVSGASAPGGKLEITISSVTMERSPWLPFFKDGACKFTANYTLEAAGGGSHIHVQGTINGEIEQSTRGLCSLGRFREHMGKALASAIVNEIQKMIAKNG